MKVTATVTNIRVCLGQEPEQKLPTAKEIIAVAEWGLAGRPFGHETVEIELGDECAPALDKAAQKICCTIQALITEKIAAVAKSSGLDDVEIVWPEPPPKPPPPRAKPRKKSAIVTSTRR